MYDQLSELDPLQNLEKRQLAAKGRSLSAEVAELRVGMKILEEKVNGLVKVAEKQPRKKLSIKSKQ